MLRERLTIDEVESTAEGKKSRNFKFTEKSTDAYVVEPEKRVPVLGEADVAVVGAGTSGLFAAIAAARLGAKTVLIDRFGMVGGNLGPAMIIAGSIAPGYPHGPEGGFILPQGPAGIAKEFVDRMLDLLVTGQYGSHDPNTLAPNYADESNVASYVGTRMAEEADVELLLSVCAADPVVEAGRLTGLFLEGPSGRGAIRAGVIIDATGNASVADRAGAPMIYHVGPDPAYKCLVAERRLLSDFAWWNETGLACLVGGIDFQRYREAYSHDEKALREEYGPPADQYGDDIGYLKVALNGQFEHRSTLQMSAIETIIRKRAFEKVLRMREGIPGCEHAYLLATASYLGGRGGSCIEGEHTLTLDEAYNGTEFDDVLYRVIFRRPFVTGHNKHGFEVPYRILLPKGIDGLLVTGRGASYIRRGHDGPGIRPRPSMMTLGEATGTAAALAVRDGCTPRALDVKLLQSELVAAGIPVGNRERLRDLGIS